MLVLDLMSEINPQYKRLDSYFGQPYIWCMLHNFGGTLGMHGTARRVNEVSIPDVYHFSTFIYMDEWDINEESGAILHPQRKG